MSRLSLINFQSLLSVNSYIMKGLEWEENSKETEIKQEFKF
jgi:hypothetical protein